MGLRASTRRSFSRPRTVVVRVCRLLRRDNLRPESSRLSGGVGILRSGGKHDSSERSAVALEVVSANQTRLAATRAR